MNYIDELHSEMTGLQNIELHTRGPNRFINSQAHSSAQEQQQTMTQSDVAEHMGATQSAVARLEDGRSKPSMQTLDRFDKATGTRVKI